MIVDEELDELVQNLADMVKARSDRLAQEPMRVFGTDTGDGISQIYNRIDETLNMVRESRDQGMPHKKIYIATLTGDLLLLMLYKGWTNLDELID